MPYRFYVLYTEKYGMIIDVSFVGAVRNSGSNTSSQLTNDIQKPFF